MLTFDQRRVVKMVRDAETRYVISLTAKGRAKLASQYARPSYPDWSVVRLGQYQRRNEHEAAA